MPMLFNCRHGKGDLEGGLIYIDELSLEERGVKKNLLLHRG